MLSDYYDMEVDEESDFFESDMEFSTDGSSDDGEDTYNGSSSEGDAHSSGWRAWHANDTDFPHHSFTGNNVGPNLQSIPESESDSTGRQHL